MEKTIDRFQFKKGQESNNRVMTLEHYAEIMQQYPYEVNPKANTLWIPFDSSNRCATLNLNHKIEGFDTRGYLIGVNGNCGTPYIVILVPPFWNRNTLDILAEKLVNKYRLKDKDPLREIKAFNIDKVIDLIVKDKDFH
jgi:hypothetical protein